MGKYAPAYGRLHALPAPTSCAGRRKDSNSSRSLSRCRRVSDSTRSSRARESARAGSTGRRRGLTVVGTIAAATAAAAFADGLGLVRAVTGASPPASLDAAFVTGDARRSAAFLVVGVLALAVAAFRPAPARLGAGLVLLVSFANLHVLSREIQFVGDDSLFAASPAVAPRAEADGTEGHLDTRYGDAGFGLYGSHDAAAFRAAAAVLSGQRRSPYGVSSTYAGDALILMRPTMVFDALYAQSDAARERVADALAIDREIAGRRSTS